MLTGYQVSISSLPQQTLLPVAVYCVLAVVKNLLAHPFVFVKVRLCHYLHIQLENDYEHVF